MSSDASGTARWLRLLLRAYPARHRRLFGDEIVAMAEQQLASRPSASTRLRDRVRIGVDLLRNAWLVRRDRRRGSPPRLSPHPRGSRGDAMQGPLTDLRTALRALRRSPGFTLVAVAMMAVAIAATTATYSLVDAILLRPLPFAEPERLVQLWESNPDKGWATQTAAPANALDWRERTESFTDIAFYVFFSDDLITLTGQGGPETLTHVAVSGNLFSVLGVQPAAGRFFTWEETWDGGADSVVISHSLWRNRFDADPGIVGRALTLEGAPVTVIGVAPRTFRLHDADPDLWSTFDWDPEVRARAWFRRAHFVHPIARLAPGIDLESARRELELIASRLEAEHPDLNRNMGAGLTPLHEWVVADARHALLILLGAVVSVLLVACVNLAHLLLARGNDRRAELELRRAIGASGLRLIAPVLLESLLLGAAASVAGIVGAFGLVHLARTYGPADVPRLWETGVDPHALAVAVAIGLSTALLCAAAPARAALRASRLGGESATRTGSSRQAHRAHRLLVAAEVALAMVLVVCAGAFVRSLARIGAIDPGFDPEGLVAVTVQLPGHRYPGPERKIEYFETLADNLAALPEVRSAGLIDSLPIKTTAWTTALTIEGMGGAGFVPEIQHRAAGPGYFFTMGVELIAGRDFRSGDEELPAMILNRTVVERHFAGIDPLGRRVKMARPDEEGTWYTVVGVVEDEKQYDLRDPVGPALYEPFRQDPDRQMTIVLRTSAPADQLDGPVRAAIAGLDDAVPPRSIETMQSVLRGSLERERFLLRLLGAFAGTALLLASVGIYGVLAHWVSGRRREMGIRQALGAGAPAITRLVVGQSIGAVAAGAAVGLLAAIVAGRSLESLLYEVSPTEPMALVLVAVLVLLVGLVASVLPVRRALRVDPQQTLRTD
ncbi:MAG TPA: ABC transporter permease [Thermoanaerobaculia bacterium]|nr:ABC transporter permease [Thermoanaerobaculia bacterium]